MSLISVSSPMLKLEILPLLFFFLFQDDRDHHFNHRIRKSNVSLRVEWRKKKKEKEEKANFRSKYGDLLNRQTRDPRAEVNGERRGKYKFLESAGRED